MTPSSRPPRRRRWLLAFPVATLTLSIAACGGTGGTGGQSAGTASGPDPNAPEASPPGDIPDNQAFVRYAPAGASYSVKVPEGWSRSTSAAGITFTDKLNSITVRTRPAKAPLTVAQAGGA